MSMKTISLSLLLSVTVSSQAMAQGTTGAKIKDITPPKTVEPLSEDTVIPPAVKESKLKLTVGMVGSSKEDPFLNSKYVGGSVAVAGEKAFSPIFSGRLGISFLLATGNFSNRYGSEGAAPNATSLDEAVLELRPIEALAIQAGVVTTEFSPFISTFEANGFPGLKESLTLKGNYLAASFYAMQAIPVSSTPAVKTTEGGITSSFEAYGMDISTNPKDEKGLTLKASAMHFEFDNLNSSAAIDSKDLGNTVQAVNQARFAYGFVGTEVGVGGSYKFSEQTTFKMGGTLIRNDLAPELKNRGYVYSAGLTTGAFKGLFTTSIGYFYNESDTLPASYVSGTRGFNNRFGQFVNFKHELEKDKITSFLKYTRVNEIEDRPLTADRDHVSVGLEVAYEIL